MPKHHPTQLSGDDRKALAKELAKAKTMTVIHAQRSIELCAEGEALIRKADRLASESWNEKMWSSGGPVEPSPTIGRADHGGLYWLEIKCSGCHAASSIDLGNFPTAGEANPSATRPIFCNSKPTE